MLTMGMMLSGANLPRHAATIGTNGAEWIFSNYAASVGLSLSQPIELTLTVLAGVERQSSSTAFGALHLNGLAPGSIVRLANSGYLLGCGGTGGKGGVGSDPLGGSGYAGSMGGPALWADFTGVLFITNGSGYLWGGGGGGGGGAGGDLLLSPTQHGGGGGGGAGGGAGGAAGGTGAVAGTAGTTTRTGAGGGGGAGVGAGATAGATGGSFGVAGSAGAAGTWYGGGIGGAGGYSVLRGAGTTVSWVSGSSRVLGGTGTIP